MKRLTLTTLALLGLALLAAPAAPAQTVDITVIDVGQGDSILIQFPASQSTGDRKRLLIDGGSSAATNNAVVQTLNNLGITKLDIVMLTHPHFDHYAGLTGLFNATNPDGSHIFTVDEFWWTGEARGPSRNETTPTTWTDFENARSRAGADHVVQQNEEHKYQKARIVFLNAGGQYPQTNAGRNINNDSIVMMLYFKSVKVLFTGDIEAAEGLDLAQTYCNLSRGGCKKLNCDILKIPHHGSGHFSPHFVRFADPEHILVSAGFTNRQFHHPRETALLAYQQNPGDETFYSTSLDGDNNLTVTIGPSRNQFTVPPAQRNFTYWIDMDELDSCGNEVHGGFCLEFWPLQ